jgi:hypothetical protein
VLSLNGSLHSASIAWCGTKSTKEEEEEKNKKKQVN